MATIGEGLASFGRNVAERRKQESNLALQKEALSQRKAEFDLNKQIKDAQLEDIFNEREEKKRLNDIRSTASGVIGSVSPQTEQVTSIQDISRPQAPQIQAQETGVADFLAGALPAQAQERTFTDVTESTGVLADIPEEVTQALSSLTKKGRRGRRVKNAKSASVVDDFLSGKLDEVAPKEFKKGKRGRNVETQESKDNRKEAKDTLMSQLVSGETPTVTTSIPDQPLGVEQLPEEAQPVAVGDFLAGALPEQAEFEGAPSPLATEEVVTEEARFKSPAEMQQEIAQKFSQIDGFSELPVNEQQEFFRQAMLGQQSEQDKAELDLTNAKLDLTEAQTSKLLGEMGSSLDPKKLQENQAKSLRLYKRMRDASSNFISLIDPNGEVGFDPTSFWSGVEEFLPNVLVRENKQQYEAFTQQWVQSVLRDDSGAAVPENEQNKYTKIFIPRFGDTPATVQAKMRMIKSTEQAMKSVLSIQGLDDKQIFTQLHEMSPSANVKFMNSIKTSRDIRDAVEDGLLSPQQASDVALLKGVNFAGGGDTVAGGKFKIVAR